jgi:Uma2 family endonuclease
MAMPRLATRRDWTVESLHALPDDGNRYEIIDGELLVSPAPALVHQRASRELVRLLLPYVDAVGGFELFFAPAAVKWSPNTEVQPDILVLPLLSTKPTDRFEDVGVLELAIEILSPWTARADRYRKRALYQEKLVPQYWIVDPAARMIECWRPDDEEPEVALTELTWQPRAEHSPLTIALRTYFRAVHGE